MKIEFEGKTWTFELQAVTNKQTKKALEYAGATSLGQLVSRIDEQDDPAFMGSLEAMYWLVLRQNGDETPIAEVDFAWPAFLRAFAESLGGDPDVQAAVKEAAPDPTQPPVVSAPSPEPSSPKAKAVSEAAGGEPPDG